jgi:Na+/H+ antiporter NhaD/arsenite permease-like protein
MAPRGQLVLGVGVGALVFVPIFKALTGLPPFMGMLLGLGILWILTDAIHYGDSERQRLKVPQALSRIDTQGILFFLGILLSIGRYFFLLSLLLLEYFRNANAPLRIVYDWYTILLIMNEQNISGRHLFLLLVLDISIFAKQFPQICRRSACHCIKRVAEIARYNDQT